MIARLQALLEQAGVGHALPGQADAGLSVDELRDVLWLAVTTAAPDAAAPGTGHPGGQGSPAHPDEPGADGAAGAGGDADGADRPHPDDPRAEPGDEQKDGATAGLFAAVGGAAGRTLPARSVSLRGARALPPARGLDRALRPLRRSVPSHSSFTVDEAATADWIAETGLPDAQLRPRRERWLSVALVVDDGPSMVLWRQLAAEVRALLERQGAFLHLRTYGLDSSSATAPTLRSRPYAPGAPRRTPRQLTDPSGRTVVLVLSDGVGPGWGSGAIPRMLHGWARHSPVAVVQPLPVRMWPQRGMPTERLLVSAPRAGCPGRALSVRHPVLPPDMLAYEGTPVPVLEATEGQLGAWSALVGGTRTEVALPVLLLDGATGAHSGPPGVATPPPPTPTPTPTPQAQALMEAPVPAEDLPQERLRRFLGGASPEGRRLAGALASVSPLTLPVMRLVHQAGGGSRASGYHPAQLAEVFLGGLLRSRDGGGAGRRLPAGPDEAVYEFHPGVADLLLDGVGTSEAMDTAERVTEFLLRRQGGGPEFGARLSDGSGEAAVLAEARPFAAASAELLERLGLDEAMPPERGGEEPAEERAEGPAEGPAEDSAEAPGEGLDAPPPTVPASPTAPAPDFPPRSHTSERVEPQFTALLLDLAADELPLTVRAEVDQLLAQAHDRDEETGWGGVSRLQRLAAELVATNSSRFADMLCLEILEQLEFLKSEHDLESRNLRGHLAMALNVLGRHDDAEEHLRAVCRISARVHGEHHRYTFNARAYLMDLLEAAGRYEAAEQEAAELLEAQGAYGEGFETDFLRIQHERSRYLIQLKRYAEAEHNARAVAAGRYALLGPTHFATLASRTWLAIALVRHERHEEAEAEMRAALAECRATPTSDRAGTHFVWSQLALCLTAQKRHEEAEAEWRRLLDEVSETEGPTHWRVLSGHSNLIDCLRKQGRFDEALAEADQLAVHTEEVKGNRHSAYFQARTLAAQIARDAGRYDEAEQRYAQLARETTAARGGDHAETLSAWYQLAYTLYRAERYEEALTQFTELLLSYPGAGADEEQHVSAQHFQAMSLKHLGRLTEAEGAFRLTVQLGDDTLGPDHRSTLSARWELGNVLRKLGGRLREATEHFSAVLHGRLRSLGPEAKPTLTARHSLGLVLLERGLIEQDTRQPESVRRSAWLAEFERRFFEPDLLGRGLLDAAEYHLGTTLRARLRVLGPEHANTLRTRQRLGEVYAGMGRVAEAEAEWADLLDTAVRVLGDAHYCTQDTRRLLDNLRHPAPESAPDS